MKKSHQLYTRNVLGQYVKVKQVAAPFQEVMKTVAITGLVDALSKHQANLQDLEDVLAEEEAIDADIGGFA